MVRVLEYRYLEMFEGAWSSRPYPSTAELAAWWVGSGWDVERGVWSR